MKITLKLIFTGLLLFIFSGCLEENISPLTDLESIYGEVTSLTSIKSTDKVKQNKVTGLVQIEWKGGKGMDNGNQPEEMLAFAGFEAFEGTDPGVVRGSFVYQVTTPDLIVHREVVAQLRGVVILPDDKKGFKTWMIGEVISDTKGCAGNGQGGHDSSCQGGACSGHDGSEHDGGCSGSDGTDHTDGGCSGSDGTDHTDGGCSGSDGTDHTDGGCSNPDHSTGDHTTGGCSGSDGTDHSGGGCSNPDHSTGDHTTGGCSGSDGTDHTDGGCSNPDHSTGDHTDGGCSGSGGSPGGMGSNVKGKHCRIGQIIALKCHDGGTPGFIDDGITWKWYSAENAPDITDTGAWPHLCKKTILEGNIKLHMK